jgi:hypothetical protein
MTAELNGLDEPVSNPVGQRYDDFAEIGLDLRLRTGLSARYQHPTFDANFPAQCRFDTYLSRPHRPIVERGLAWRIAFPEFSGDIEHVPLTLFVMRSLCPSASLNSR